MNEGICTHYYPPIEINCSIICLHDRHRFKQFYDLLLTLRTIPIIIEPPSSPEPAVTFVEALQSSMLFSILQPDEELQVACLYFHVIDILVEM
jgi:hypothetical protein